MVCSPALILASAVVPAVVSPLDYLLSAAQAETPVDESSVIGKAFVVTLPFTVDDATVGTNRTHARYRHGHGDDALILNVDPASSYEERPPLIKLITRYASAGSFAGRSGLGVRVRVQKRQDRTSSIALVSAPLPDELPASQFLPASRMTDYFYSTEAPIRPSDLEVIIEGVTAKLPSGKMTGCANDFYAADVQTPVDVRVRTCWVGANVTRIAFRQRSTAKVLKEWRDPSH